MEPPLGGGSISAVHFEQSEEIGASYIPASIAAETYLEQPTVVPKALFLCVEDLSGPRYAHASDR